MSFEFKGRRIICFSTADWDTALPTNKHQLMRRLAAMGARVLFIETLGTRAPKLGQGVDLSRIGRRLWRGFEGARQREKRLWTLSPLVRPAWKTRNQIELNRAIFRSQFASASDRFAGDIAWIYSPYAVHLLDVVKPGRVVYHMVDDLSAVPGADSDAMNEAELLLFSRADLVFATEQSLYDRARRFARKAHYFPNVADYRHFSEPKPVSEGCAARLERLRSLPRPRIVFSGNLAPHKVDFPLIEAMARARPDAQFALIGPRWEGDTSESLDQLVRMENVTLTGHIPYEDLPAFLHEADLLIIPYVKNKATRAVFPLKFFEYLATGVPVASSPLPSLLPYQGVVDFAESEQEWIALLKNADLTNRSRDRAKHRRALARRHTWSRRLEEMRHAIESLEKNQ